MAQFQLSEKEFVRGSMVITWKRRTLVMFGIAYLLVVTSLAFRRHTLIESAVYPLLGIVALVVLVYFLTRFRLGKAFNETAVLHETMNVAIDDQQLSYTWARGNYILPWASIRRGMETRNFFFLFESSYFGRMLPKRALSDEETTIIRQKLVSIPRR
jgi:YcxB-like protein